MKEFTKAIDRLELPISIQDFKSIREGKYYYVDKTTYIKKMAISEVTGKKKLGYYFLSRPRRFGKSMIVDTLQCLYEGRKELFEGLHIYDKWDWSVKHPVIRLSFGKGEHNSRGDIDMQVRNQLFEVKRKYKWLFIFSYIVELFSREFFHRDDAISGKVRGSHQADRSRTSSNKAANKLSRLVSVLHKRTGKKVVVLIDEYDMPILDVFDKPEMAREHTSYLRGLYGTLKDHERDIQLAFITGISMFSKVNLFSRINNFYDISLDSDFAGICGYSEKDLKTVFAPEMTPYDIEDIRHWYDGYNWDVKNLDNRLFCPYSVLDLFKRRDFGNWWYKSCMPRYMYELLKKNHITLVNISERNIHENFLECFEVDSPNIDTLLFQNGYLTIRDAKNLPDGKNYKLVFPNLEVSRSLSRSYLEYLIGGPYPASRRLSDDGKNLITSLACVDGQKFEATIKAILAGISYHAFKNLQFAEYEACYGVFLYALFAPLRPEVIMEEATARGRSDLVIKYQDKVFVAELKCIDSHQVNPDDQAIQALEQINRCGYGDKYKVGGVSCYAVAMIFGKKERNILKVQIEDLA